MKNSNQCAVYYCTFTTPTKSYTIQKKIALQVLHHAFLTFFNTELQESHIKRTANGKPYYEQSPNYFFNISHCATAIAVALAHTPVGIDIESPRPVKPGTLKKCCSPSEISYIFSPALPQTQQENLTPEQEKRFLNLWTLKESYVKMTGEGLRTPLSTICFDIPKFQKLNQDLLQWIQPGRHHSYLYSQKNIIISLALQYTPTIKAFQIQWHSCTTDTLPTQPYSIQ